MVFCTYLNENVISDYTYAPIYFSENQSWNYTISSSPPESKMVCNGSPNDSGDKGGDKNGKKENGDGTNGDHGEY